MQLVLVVRRPSLLCWQLPEQVWDADVAPDSSSISVAADSLQAEKRAAEASSQFQDLYKKAPSSWTPVWLQERFGKVKPHALISRSMAGSSH